MTVFLDIFYCIVILISIKLFDVGNHLGCPIGWDGWNEWCYYMTTRSSNLNHGQARERCLSYGGDLVSIHSQAEQDFVTSLLFKNCK